MDDGMSCEVLANVLLLDDDTIRTTHGVYEEHRIEGLGVSATNEVFAD